MTDLHDEIPREFLFMGQNMEKVTVFYGFFLAAWGVGVSSVSGSESITSLIPSIIGLPLIILGISSLLFPKLNSKEKHFVQASLWI